MSANLYSQWLSRATEDLVVARLVLNEDHPAYACFLAQQCIEKALKAFLLHTVKQYPRTHKLVDLLGECRQAETSFAQFTADCAVVDQYYIPTRYPDGVPGSVTGGLPGATEAGEAVAIADRILNFVTRRLA